MRRFKKIVTCMGLVSAMTACMFGNVMAQTTTAIYGSPVWTAGEWYSGCANNAITSVKATYMNVYGGEVDMNIHVSNIGLPNTFHPQQDRVIELELKEHDYGYSESLVARRYKGYINMEGGVYRITRYINTFTNKERLEENGEVELYIRFRVATNSADTSKNIPKNFFGYQYIVQ